MVQLIHLPLAILNGGWNLWDLKTGQREGALPHLRRWGRTNFFLNEVNSNRTCPEEGYITINKSHRYYVMPHSLESIWNSGDWTILQLRETCILCTQTMRRWRVRNMSCIMASDIMHAARYTKYSPCTLACTATLAEMKPETFWRKIGNKSYQPWLPKGSKKAPRPIIFKREGGVR